MEIRNNGNRNRFRGKGGIWVRKTFRGKEQWQQRTTHLEILGNEKYVFDGMSIRIIRPLFHFIILQLNIGKHLLN